MRKLARRRVSKEGRRSARGGWGLFYVNTRSFFPGRMSRNSNEIKEHDTAAAAVKNTAGPFVADSRNLIRI